MDIGSKEKLNIEVRQSVMNKLIERYSSVTDENGRFFQLVVKSSIILNGGAILAILAFIGATISKSDQSANFGFKIISSSSYLWCMVSFIAGLASSYLSILLTQLYIDSVADACEKNMRKVVRYRDEHSYLQLLSIYYGWSNSHRQLGYTRHFYKFATVLNTVGIAMFFTGSLLFMLSARDSFVHQAQSAKVSIIFEDVTRHSHNTFGA